MVSREATKKVIRRSLRSEGGAQNPGFHEVLIKGMAGPPNSLLRKKVVRFFFIVEHMMKRKKIKFRKSQVILEYMVIFAIVVAAIATVGFLSNIKVNFSEHQDKCVDVILERE